MAVDKKHIGVAAFDYWTGEPLVEIPEYGQERLDFILGHMRELAKDKDKPSTSQDTQTAHKAADCLLCIVLRSLGQDELVDEYEKIDKWYS